MSRRDDDGCDDSSVLDPLRDSDIFDPLRVERSASISDREAADIEALCQAATAGPLLTDDETEGDGVVVASLPDGRHIVSLTAQSPAEHRSAVEANARLICKARYLLLRLLRDRARWRAERRRLCERMRALEATLEKEDQTIDQVRSSRPHDVPSRPR